MDNKKDKIAVYVIVMIVMIAMITSVGNFIYTYQSNELRKKQEVEKQDIYYLASFQQASQNYYLLVYTKNGETHYPHFFTEKQADMFVEHLETQGIVIKNGYDKEYIKGDKYEY